MGKKNYTIKNGGKRNPLNIVIVIVTIVVLIGTYFITRSGNDGLEPETKPTASVVDNNNPLDPNSDYDKATKEVYIITDKWSLLNLPNTDLKINVGGFTSTLVFNPLTADEYKNILKVDPIVISKAMGRFYSSNKSLTCSVSACTIEKKNIDPAILATPSSIPGFGEMYSAYGIDSILYQAKVKIPVNADVATIEGAGLKSSSVVFGTNDDGSSTAYQYISNAFGVIYPVSVAWNADSTFVPEERYEFSYSGKLSTGSSIPESKLYGIFAKGLAYSNPLISSLNNTQLAYLSSPSTGCGSLSLCVPGLFTSEQTLGKSEKFKVCASDKTTGEVFIIYGTTNFSLPKPSFIPGLVNYQTNDTNNVTGILGLPKLITGSQKFYTFEAYLYTSTGVSTFAGGRSITPTGLPKVTLDQLFKNAYKKC